MLDKSKTMVSTQTPTAPIATGLNVALIVLSVIGAADAGTLWWAHRQNIDLPCTEDGGCSKDFNGPYGHITVGGHDIPVALLGLIGYLVLFTIAMAKGATETRSAYRILSTLGCVISIGGFGYSFFLQYAALFIEHAFCPWCFASACIMTSICVISIIESIKLSRIARLDIGGTKG